MVGPVGRDRVRPPELLRHGLGRIDPASVGNRWDFRQTPDHGLAGMLTIPPEAILGRQGQAEPASPEVMGQAVAGPQNAGMPGMGRPVGRRKTMPMENPRRESAPSPAPSSPHARRNAGRPPPRNRGRGRRCSWAEGQVQRRTLPITVAGETRRRIPRKANSVFQNLRSKASSTAIRAVGSISERRQEKEPAGVPEVRRRSLFAGGGRPKWSGASPATSL